MAKKISKDHKNDSKFNWLDLIKAIWYFLEGKRKKYVFLSFIVVTISLFDLLPPYLLGKIVDFFTAYEFGESLTIIYVYLLVLGLGGAIAAFIRLSSKRYSGNIGDYARYQARIWSFDRLLNFSLRWHDKENTGNKVERIHRGADTLPEIQRIFQDKINHESIAIIGVLIIFFFLSTKFFVFLIAYLIVFFFLQIFFYKHIKVTIDAVNTQNEKTTGVYFEGVGNLLTIKTLGVKDSFSTNVVQAEAQKLDLNYERRRIGMNKWISFRMFNALAGAIFIWLVVLGVIEGSITIGAILVFYTYFNQLSSAAADITETFDRLVEHKSAIERMMPIFNETEAVYHGTEDFPQEWDNIAMIDGSFSYKEYEENQEHDYDLKNIGLVIRKHEKIGIVGKSGSGKSTLAKIMLGLYKLDRGEFMIGESSFYDIDNIKLTEHMTTVMQDSEMFNMTLKENITLMRKIDEVLLKRAIDVSKLDEVIDKLPQGLDTLIGEKGYRLSGGERQRVGIARAIYKDPEILVLDEATSSLDSKTEASIQHGLEEELTKKTMIMIAHRISTLKNVDKIYVFDEGRIVESGTFDELSANKDSKFYEIYQMQNKQDL